MAAAANSDPELVQLLLDRGAKVDQQDNKGRTALYWAVKQELPDVIAVLLKAGADPDLAAADGNTPRQLAESLKLAAFFPATATK
jgi:ankyrin repeat protein